MSTLELVCPAGTPAALKAAVDSGADAVYLGFRDATNARNFPGLNFSRDELAQSVTYAHERGSKIFLAINTFPKAGEPGPWHQAVDDGAALGVDAVILADIGLLDYASRVYPDLRRHLSVQASASNPEAICFYQDAFDVKRVVLPRVLSVAEIAALNKEISVETEVFVFGGLCVMAEGRCALSSYVTGQSPNTNGVCSPACDVHYQEHDDGRMVSKLGDFTINAFEPGEPAGYPTLCKGRFTANGQTMHLFEDPVSLNAASILPELAMAGVTGLKIEGRRVRIEHSKGLKDRIVCLSQMTVDALQAYLDLRGPAIGDHVFTFRHQPLSVSYCSQRLRTYGRRCGVRVTPHQLRHTCATLLLNAGAPILTVQTILGHKYIDTTLAYARLYDGTVAADYYRAMGQIEARMALAEGASDPLTGGQLLALVDALRDGTLNENQRETVQALRVGILALAEQQATEVV